MRYTQNEFILKRLNKVIGYSNVNGHFSSQNTGL